MKCTILFLSVLGLFACRTAQQEVDHDSAILLTDLQNEIDSIFHEVIDEDEPGAALLVAYDGEMIIGKGYGLSDVKNSIPMTQHTNLRMASVSKQFTALCILALVDQGKVSLQDSVTKYLAYPIFKNMQIEHLLNHTSGLPDYYEHFEEGWDQNNILENREVLEWLATNPPLVFEPGTQWEYSNTAYLMVALIVEEASGMEFSEFAKKFVFSPAGMNSTTYFNLAHPVQIPNRALCYEKDSTERFNQVDGYFMNGVIGDGAVYTSVQDYFNYDQSLRNETIVSETSHDLIFKPSSSHVVDGQERNYAMGWGVTDSTATHTGGWFGTNTYVKRYLNKPLTLGIFMNRNTLFNSPLVSIADSLVMEYVQSIEQE